MMVPFIIAIYNKEIFFLRGGGILAFIYLNRCYNSLTLFAKTLSLTPTHFLQEFVANIIVANSLLGWFLITERQIPFYLTPL